MTISNKKYKFSKCNQLAVWLPVAPGLFCYLPLDNKLGSQVCKGKHQRADYRIYIIVIYTCLTEIKSLYSLNIQMWFYHHKTIKFIYPFVLEQINLRELLTENTITNYKVTNTNTKVTYRFQLGQCDTNF